MSNWRTLAPKLGALVLLSLPCVAHGAPAADEADDPEAKPEYAPKQSDPDAAGATPEGPEQPSPDPAPAGPADVAAEDPSEVPAPGPAEEPAGDVDPNAATAKTSPTGSGASPSEEDPSPFGGILGAESEPTAPRPRPTSSVREEGVDGYERQRRLYDALYRPPHNPARPYFTVRTGGGFIGRPAGSAGGRHGGIWVEAGQTWNRIGYALGGSIEGGNVLSGDDQEAESNLLASVAANVSLGRIALVRRGYVDLRVGYRVGYWTVRRSAFADENTGELDPLMPHGPEFRLDTGLLMMTKNKTKFRHGLGAHLGYQQILGSFLGPLPLFGSINVGVGYFFG